MTYSAIVLTDQDREKLISRWRDQIPEGWEILAHHCTIKMGSMPDGLRENMGLPVILTTAGFYINDKVCAVYVIVPTDLSPFMANQYPHITIAVNRSAGGKPMMSNDLIKQAQANDLSGDAVGTHSTTPMKVTGIVQEVK